MLNDWQEENERTKKIISDVLLGGNHLASLLVDNGIEPDKIRNVNDVRHGPMRDVWTCWRAIMNLANEVNND